MADVSHIKAINGTTYDIRDYRIPILPNSENVYLRGDGTWQIPINSAVSSGCMFIDGGDHLKVIKPAS